MKYILPLAFLFVFTACKKETTEPESVHEPVAGLQAITSMSQIDAEVAQGVSMIFFHASWCSTCQAQRPAVSEVATDADVSAAFFGEVEYDDHTDIVNAYNVSGFPTIVIFKDGNEVNRFTGGSNSAQTLKQEILSHL